MAKKGLEINKSYEEKLENEPLPEVSGTPEYKKTLNYLKKATEKMSEGEKSLAFKKGEYNVGIYKINNGAGFVVLLKSNDPESNKFLKVKYLPDGLVKVSEIALKKEGKVEKEVVDPRVVGNAIHRVFEVLSSSKA